MVFPRTTLESSVFGTLTYGSSYWKASMSLAGFEQPFTLIVRAGQQGPAVEHEQAFQRLQAEIIPIKEQASGEMLRFHQEVQAPLSENQATPEGIWAVLVPDSIEVTSKHYDDGRTATFVLFTSVIYDDLTVAIEVLDGHFVRLTMV